MSHDLFYPIRPGSYWEYNDLRCSLRSVEMHYPNAGKVYIVGPELPVFLNPEKVIHIPAKDASDSPMVNVRSKMRLLLTEPDLSDEFLLMNDDMYFIQRCEEMPALHLGTLERAMANGAGRGYWFTAMDVTRKYLKSLFNGEPLNYEVHAPMLLQTHLVANLMLDFPNDRHLYFRTVYGNRYWIGGEQLEDDFKIHSEKDYLALRYPIRFASTSPVSIRSASVQHWLMAMFPTPSRWEMEATHTYMGKGKWKQESV